MKAASAGIGMALGLLLAGQAAAEPKELVIQVGDRIRYRVGTEKEARAVVLETDADFLRVEDKRRASFRLERSKLHSLAALRGSKRNVAAGAMIGFLPGAAFGVFAAGAVCDYGSPCDYARPGLVVGGMSAVVGAGIGALIKTDRWQRAPVGSVRFAITPARGRGVRAAVKLSF